jgi:hypothetical protein
VRALNLPFFSFLRLTFFHGPAATLAGIGLYAANRLAEADHHDLAAQHAALPVDLPELAAAAVLRRQHRVQGRSALVGLGIQA